MLERFVDGHDHDNPISRTARPGRFGLAVLAAVATSLAGADARAATAADEGGLLVFESRAAPGEAPDVRGGEPGFELVVDSATGAKQLGEPYYAPLEIDVEDAGALAGWVGDLLAGEVWRRDFAVEEDGRRRLHSGGYVTAIRLSRDGEKSSSAGALGLTLGFEEVADIAPAPAFQIEPGSTERKWLPSAFELELGDLPCAGVVELEAFAVGQPTAGAVEVPNLKVTFSAADAEAWLDWFEDFAFAGHANDADELDGSITWFGADHTETLSVQLFQVGILSLRPAVNGDGSASDERFVAELYVEDVAIESLQLAQEGFDLSR